MKFHATSRSEQTWSNHFFCFVRCHVPSIENCKNLAMVCLSHCLVAAAEHFSPSLQARLRRTPGWWSFVWDATLLSQQVNSRSPHSTTVTALPFLKGKHQQPEHANRWNLNAVQKKKTENSIIFFEKVTSRSFHSTTVLALSFGTATLIGINRHTAGTKCSAQKRTQDTSQGGRTGKGPWQ